ncbi:MAG TPA: class I SAM-dependent methyltransferase, partial [Acidimicrobiales bacterium]|nr:class I SAM-dependent methyltransferase [Acidimicrobiales bacterium]
ENREHRFFAAAYDRITESAERAGLAERRRELLAGATGRVLEIGGGTGHNLPYFTAAREVVVLEPDGAMARRMRPKLDRCPAPVRVVEAGIDHPDLAALGVEDASFDTVVSTLVLCTVPDIDAAATAVRRLMTDDAQVLFIEHVLAPTRWRARVQRAANPLWGRLAAGCHLDRDAVPSLRRAGLTFGTYDRVRLPLGPLAGPGVVGRAVVRHGPLLAEPGRYPLRSGRP